MLAYKYRVNRRDNCIPTEAYPESIDKNPAAVLLLAKSTAVISPDLEARLIRADIPPDLARNAAQRLQQLVASRYGGAPTTDAELDATLALFDRLEAV